MDAARCQTCRYDMTGLTLVRCPECGGCDFADRSQFPPVVLCTLHAITTILLCHTLAATMQCESGGHCSIVHSFLDLPKHRSLTLAGTFTFWTLLTGPTIAAIASVFNASRCTLRLAIIASLLGQIGLVGFNHLLNKYDLERVYSPATIGLLFACFVAAGVLCVVGRR